MDIKINDDIADALKKRINDTGQFSTVDEYVDYILKQVVARFDNPAQEKISKEEKEKVKGRLRDLGYLK